MNTRTFLFVAAERRAWICLLATLFLTSGWAPAAHSVEVPTLFTAEVALNARATNPHEEAYAAALLEVLARVSSSELSSNASAVAELFPNPESYVTQFRPGTDDTLWVSFDGEAIEKVLRGAGEIVWGSNRPLTLVWLAVDWGQGQREIIGADDPGGSRNRTRSIDRNRLLRERVLEIAQKRGLPLAFPLLDTTDLQSVTSSDIWGGFNERVVAASARYDADSILIGRVRASSGQSNRWSYFLGGEERAWTGSPELVVAQIADMMAAEFAVGGNAPLEMVALNISGVESVDAYGSVQNLLDGVALIENFRIASVSGDKVSYQIEVRGGAGRLRRALRFAGLIEEEGSDGLGIFDAASSLEFFYNPR